jgi:hypothetical protein
MGLDDHDGQPWPQRLDGSLPVMAWRPIRHARTASARERQAAAARHPDEQ